MDMGTDNMAWKIGTDYAIIPTQDTKYDPHYTDYPYQRYFVFANWRDRSNILIKFNEDELE